MELKKNENTMIGILSGRRKMKLNIEYAMENGSPKESVSFIKIQFMLCERANGDHSGTATDHQMKN